MPLGNGRNARIHEYPADTWTNRHQNEKLKFDRFYDVWNPAPPIVDFFGDLRLTVAMLQHLMDTARQDGKTLRAIGAGWSLSRAAMTNGRLVNTAPLNWYYPPRAGDILAGYTGQPSSLMYLQCGVSVDEANHLLASRPQPLALKTSGASNGQTIAGAVSTGTHGSAFQFGSMPDYVVALHLVTGPDRAVWLERQSYPVVTDSLAATLGAQIIRDDVLFNSALVSFGSFGIVHGVMIETEPLYLLEASRIRLPIDATLEHAMTTLDFSALPMPYPAEVPHHFEVVVNPHDVAGGAYVTIMYKRPYRTNYPPPTVSPGGLGPGDDVLAVMGSIAGKLPVIVAPLVNAVVASNYPVYAAQWGTPGEIFFSNTTHQKEMCTEIGISLEQTARALRITLDAPSKDAYPGLIAFRFVKRSGALLAFTKFDATCTIELPAAYSTRTVDYYDSVWSGLEAAGVPYTLHWGQQNNFTAKRVRAMYGGAVDAWTNSRNALLDPSMRAVFSSPFLQKCGLA